MTLGDKINGYDYSIIIPKYELREIKNRGDCLGL